MSAGPPLVGTHAVPLHVKILARLESSFIFCLRVTSTRVGRVYSRRPSQVGSDL
jgi:hypothetical protein